MPGFCDTLYSLCPPFCIIWEGILLTFRSWTMYSRALRFVNILFSRFVFYILFSPIKKHYYAYGSWFKPVFVGVFHFWCVFSEIKRRFGIVHVCWYILQYALYAATDKQFSNERARFWVEVMFSPSWNDDTRIVICKTQKTNRNFPHRNIE